MASNVPTEALLELMKESLSMNIFPDTAEIAAVSSPDRSIESK